MDRSFALGRLFNIEFRIHYTWFIIFFLLIFLLVEPNFRSLSYWLIGITTSFLFFASVLFHELAHSLVGRAQGLRIESITLFIFGGMAIMEGEMNKPGAEFRMAVAGPAASLMAGGLFAVFLLIPVNNLFTDMFIWLAIMNGLLAVFNLLPGFPLDGGRVFRSIVWKVTGSYLIATRVATIVGQGFGYFFILAGIFILVIRPFGMTWYNGLWISVVGLFLANAASSSYRSVFHPEKTPPPSTGTIITSAEYTVLPDENRKEKE